MSRRAIALLVAIGGVLIGAAPANASIALVQKGTEASNGGTSITATLPAGTTAGNLLVASIMDLNSGCSTDTITAPAGWAKAAHVCRAGTGPGPLELWYYANAPAGITSVTFNTGSTGANSVAQLSEWSGAATSSPLDQTGTASNSSSSTSLTVTTTGTIAAAGELAITSFDTSAGLASFTPDTGWSTLRSDPGNGFDSDYQINPASGSTVSETITANPQTNFGAVIATFKSAACTGGSLSVKAPSSLTFPALTLNGYSSSATANLTVTADDETGTASGWNLNVSSTTLTAGPYTLPTTATTVTSAAATAASGNCSMPTSSVTYPVTIPAAPTPPTPATLYNAAAATGKGPVNITFAAKITVPGNARAGSYGSTWTLTMASGP